MTIEDRTSRFQAAEAKVHAHAEWFERSFASYFDLLLAKQERPDAFSYPTECLQALRELSLAGGKRQRVAFFLEAARLPLGSLPPGAEQIAWSIELLQAHLLIHDDIIDDSPMRRGVPSTLYRFRRSTDRDDSRSLGLALLTGDIASSLAFDVLAAAPIERLDLLRAQLRAHVLTCLGQAADLERDDRPRQPPELDQVSDFKATRSSAFAPMELGLLLAGAESSEFRDTVLEYGRQFGISGQMRDDYISLYGDPEVTGKSTEADIRDGRLTYVISLALQRADAAQRRVLDSNLGNERATSRDIARVREVLNDTGAAEVIRQQSIEHAERASVEAASWRGRWDDDAVEFFEVVPVWGAMRAI